jgi:hypothetical protein
MRTVLLALVSLLLLVQAAPARADDISGNYDVKYEEVSTNCGDHQLTYGHGKLKVEVKGKQLLVDIDRTPKMVGVPAGGGKVSAKSKVGETMLKGMNGVFSVAGRITPEGQLHLVMVGEFSVDGKPLCTQSWNVAGPKAEATPPPKDTKPAPAPKK